MESYKNNIIHNELNKNNTQGLAAIRDMILAHKNMLEYHFKYIVKIKINEIPDDEIYDYLNDVLNFSVPNNGKLKETYLPLMLQSLTTLLKNFRKLNEIANHPNEQIAISTVYMLLEVDLAFAKYNKKMNANKTVKVEDKMQSILSSEEYIKSMLVMLKKILPAGHQQLAKICYFETMVSKENHIKKFDASWVFNWRILTSEVYEIIRSSKKDFAKYISPQREDEAIADMGCIERVIKSRIEASDKQVYENDNDYSMGRILENVEAFYQLKPLLDKFYQTILQFKEECEAAIQLEKSYQQAFDKLCINANKLKGQCDSISKKIDSVYRKQKWKNHVPVFDKLLQQVNEQVLVITALPDKYFSQRTDDSWTEELFAQKLFEALKESQDIRFSLKEIEKNLSVIIESEKHPQHDTQTYSSSNQLSLNQDNERSIFLKEREILNKEYKDSVERLRSKKEESRQYKNRNVANIQENTITIYKNTDFEKLLLSISDHYFTLLQDIFEYKKNIHYFDVYYLITNQLQGEIEEIGNGSSHKRIRIAKYFVEVISHKSQNISKYTSETTVDDISNVSSIPMSAVGGFFRPHNKSHHSGIMSRFNLELIIGVFQKAGITAELLKNISQMRTGRSLSC